MNNAIYHTTDSDLWTGRIDSNEHRSSFRWHQVVKCVDLAQLDNSNAFALLGFGCDVGVARNKGRVGAAAAPNYFRSVVGNLSWRSETSSFLDVGTIYPKEQALEEAHIHLGTTVTSLLARNKKPIIIGGGHETAFGHYLGIASFLQHHKPNSKLGIINIDAHFDLRPYKHGAHSGSPFLQALEHAKSNNLDLNYFVHGLNEHNNTSSLFYTAKEWGVQYNTNQEIIRGDVSSIKKLQGFIKHRTHIYITICLDVFNAFIAPGVSAPAWHGIQLQHALDVIAMVKNSGKLLSMDICELNPNYDQDNRTAKLAGMLVAELFQSV